MPKKDERSGEMPRAYWIESIRRKRKAGSSMVFAVRTSDPKRIEQFTAFMASRVAATVGDKQHVRAIIYDAHQGLMEGKVQGDAVAYVPMALGDGATDVFAAASPAVDAMAKAAMVSQPVAVQQISDVLRKGRAIVCMANMHSGTPELNEAVRSWCSDYALYGSQSLVVLFDGNPARILSPEALDLAVTITPPIGTDAERKSILDRVEAQYGIETNGALALTRGLNLHQVESAALETIFEMAQDAEGAAIQASVKGREMDTRLISTIKTDLISGSGLVLPEDTEFDLREGVGGWDALKEYLLRIFLVGVPKDVRESLNLQMPRGIIFHGPPGTGKTHLVKCLARTLGLPFLKLGAVKGSLVGETKRNILRVREICEAAAPALLLIDEMDVQFAAREGSSQRHVSDDEVTEELLKWLSDPRRKTIIVGCTNLPWRIDDALIRNERIEFKIPLMYPDAAARLGILRVQVEKIHRCPLAKNVDLHEVAEATALFTADDLWGVVRQATLYAAGEGRKAVGQADLMHAVGAIAVDARGIIQTAQRYIEQAKKHNWTCDERLLADTMRMAEAAMAQAKGMVQRESGAEKSAV